MTTRKLVVRPRNGLGNRLLAMGSAARIARRLGSAFGVEWMENRELTCAFGDIFDETSGYRSDTVGDPAYRTYDSVVDKLFVLDCDELRKNDFVRLIAFSHLFMAGDDFDADRRVFGNNVFFQDCTIEVGGFIREFTWSADVQRKLAIYNAVDFSNFVGIHIRKHDHAVDTWMGALDDVTTEHWRGMCLEFVKVFPNIRLFVSSNDQDDYAFIDSLADRRIFYHPKPVLDRTQREAQVDAAVDMALLAKTSLIIRHANSTFSYVSGLAGQVPQFVIRGSSARDGRIEGVLCDIGISRGRPSFVLKDWRGLGEKLSSLPRIAV